MKKAFNNFILLVIFFILNSFIVVDTEYYVSTKGNDTNPGSEKAPFLTVDRALSQIIENRKNGDQNKVTIYIEGGTYYISASLHLNKNLSNINIVNISDNKVYFNGGVPIPAESIEKGKDLRYYVDLKKVGIENYGNLRNVGFARPYGNSWGEIFVNKQPMHLSRWPNNEMIPIKKVLDPGSVPRNNDYSNRGGLLKYKNQRIDEWADEKDAWIAGYFMWGYADDMVAIDYIDIKKNAIKTKTATLYGFGDNEPWRQWYGVNIFKELDESGEYYLDRDDGLLHFIFDSAEIEIVELSLLDQPFFQIHDAKNIIIQGITFECSRSLGISMDNTENVLIQDCNFRNLGSLGISIGKGVAPFEAYKHEGTGEVKSGIVGSLQQHIYTNSTFYREGGKNNKIKGCQFYNLGAGGIILGGGNLKTLENGNNVVEDCIFYDINRIEKSYRPAIYLTGVGNAIRHCEIFNTPSMAIYMMFGNNNTIEYNYIHDVCQEVEDQGGIYYGRNPAERGNIIRYNYFKNIPDSFNTCAIYHDDGACGMTAYGNVFYKAGKWNVLIGGGSDNVYRNNIFIDNQYGIHIDNRLENWSKALLDQGGLFEKRLNAVNYQQPPYSNVYPELADYFSNPATPKRNIVENNYFINVGQLLDGNREWIQIKENNLEINDSINFTDWELKGYQTEFIQFVLIEEIDFKEIPFHSIGPRNKSER